jgi:hypothetical protein
MNNTTKRQIPQNEIYSLAGHGAPVTMNRNDFLTALFESSCISATHCVSFCDSEGDSNRVWALSSEHGEELAKALTDYGFSDIEVEEV